MPDTPSHFSVSSPSLSKGLPFFATLASVKPGVNYGPIINVAGLPFSWTPSGYEPSSGTFTFPTLSSLLSTAPKPGMRAAASDAPGSMLFEIGGKWGGDFGVGASMSLLPSGVSPASYATVVNGTYPIHVEYRGGRWLPCLVDGVMRRDFDETPTGILWTPRSSAADNSWRAITYIPSRDRLVAVAYSGTGNRVMTSDDGGVSWTIRSSAADNGWFAITYIPSRDRLVAVAESGAGNRVMTSGGYAL